MIVERVNGIITQSSAMPYMPFRASPFFQVVKNSLGYPKGYNIAAGVFDLDPPTVYCRIDDGGVFTNEDTDAASAAAADVTLLPAVEVINDAVYFGSDDPFDFIIVKLSTAAIGGTLAWEYYNGAAWVAIPGITDASNGFTAGISYYKIEWTQPSDFSSTTVNSQAGYWIRARVTAANITQTPVATRVWMGGQDEYEMDFDILADGTETKIVIGTGQGTVMPKWDLYINDVLDSSGYDDYAASGVDMCRTITLTQKLKKGWNKITMKINRKNASSSAYSCVVYGLAVY